MVQNHKPKPFLIALRDNSNNAVYRRHFPRLLRLFCQEAGINFSELARAMGLDRRTVALWASGNTIPQGEILYDLCVFAKQHGGINYLIPDPAFLLSLEVEE